MNIITLKEAETFYQKVLRKVLAKHNMVIITPHEHIWELIYEDLEEFDVKFFHQATDIFYQEYESTNKALSKFHFTEGAKKLLSTHRTEMGIRVEFLTKTLKRKLGFKLEL